MSRSDRAPPARRQPDLLDWTPPEPVAAFAPERRVQAMQMVAHEQKVALSSLYEWAKCTHGLAREDWLPALAPRHGGGREAAELPAEGWAMLKGDFLRPERPNFTACYRRLVRVAAEQGWQVPAERTLHRRMMEIPEHQRVLLRDGVDALRRMFPAQQRDRGVFHALEAVNADGHTWDVFVKWPDGAVGRPHMVAFQDLYSGKILSWRVDVALSWHAVRLAFGDMVEAFGIPRLCWLDNGREFAAMPDISVLTGAPGVGKTRAACQYKRLNPNVFKILAEPALSTVSALLGALAHELRVTEVGRQDRVARLLKQRLAGTRALIIVDEAQHLTTEMLDQLRAFHDQAEIGIALVGNSAVIGRLEGGRRSNEYAQLYSRVGMRLNRREPKKADVEALLDAWSGRLFVRVFDGAGNVREDIAGDVLASITTMQWNGPAQAHGLASPCQGGVEPARPSAWAACGSALR